MFLVVAMVSANSADLAANGQPALTVRDLILIAHQDNKDLQAAKLSVDAARARWLQAGLRPNPRLDLTNKSDWAFRNEGSYSRSFSINQPFSISGRLRRQQDVAQAEVSLAEADIALLERRLAANVAERAYRLQLLTQRIQTRDRLVAVEESLLTTARDRFKAAEVSELDLNTVQIDLQRFVQERALLRTEQRSLVVALNVLLGRSDAGALNLTSLSVPDTTLPTLASLQARALQLRPELRRAQLNGERAEAQQALARSQRWEDWSLGLELSQDRQTVTGAPPQRGDLAVGIGVSIPLPLFNKNQGLIAEATADRNQAQRQTDALRLAITSEVTAAYADYTQIRAVTRRIAEQLTPLAERNVRLAQQGYRQGLVPLFEVVQIQRQQVELAETYLSTMQAMLQARVRLHDAVGDYGAATLTSDEDY